MIKIKNTMLMTFLLVFAVQIAALNAWSSESKAAPGKIDSKSEDILMKTVSYYKNSPAV